MNKKNDMNSYHLVNTEGTKILAEQAIKNGVAIYFLSSLKVNGENNKRQVKNNLFNNYVNQIPKIFMPNQN